MPRIPDEPLRKITLNLYDSDVEWFQDVYGQGYTEQIRKELRKRLRQMQAADEQELAGP